MKQQPPEATKTVYPILRQIVNLIPRRVAVFAKLGAANRAEAVAIAMRKHLLKI